MAPTGVTICLHKVPSTISEDGCVLDFHPEQNYYKLKEEYLRKGKLFTDPYFKASSESLGYDKLGPRTWVSQKTTWKRPKDICEHGTPKFMEKGMTRHDVLQTTLGDCWFMAAAASLTFHPQLLARVVPLDQSFEEREYAGIFHFQFWQYGRWVDVVVDDLLPVLNGELRFAGHNDDFWMPLLEKAYAKLNGSYEAIDGGWLNEAFVDLTGGIGVRINLKQKQKKLFETIEMALERKSLLGAGISDFKGVVDSKGLQGGHAYSIIGTHKLTIEGKKVRLVKLRNPWGHTEWTGNWSDSSEMWSKVDSEHQKTLIEEKENKDDGEFW
ncbi:calpain-12 [Sceloporus undulatus]|uniref:calpain-12 n=1 Tax=Sceloporus undulatus TaxID=8520 RepID=UPI001C4C67CA|nr:calpain-12 [Sceloporus undulatus]